MIDIDILSKKKIGVNVLVWLTIIFILFSLNQCNRNRQLKKELSKTRTELKKDYEERIKQRELNIETLKIDNEIKRNQIERMNNKIDSLDNVKNKIIVKYIDRIKEIKVMDSQEINNYWNEQFN
jgi:GTPase involved in cell partitioning and DNA repair